MVKINKKKLVNSKQRKSKQGRGFLNSIINKLPFEAHLPGYQYCGPGTRLQKRLEKGDPGINLLDEACKEHDITYSKFDDTKNRNIGDKILAAKAWERVKSKDASLGERANALLVTNLMNAKVKMGMGYKEKTKKKIKEKIIRKKHFVMQ